MNDELDPDSDRRGRRLKQIAYAVVLVPVLALGVVAMNPNTEPAQDVYGEVLELVSSGAGKDTRLSLRVRLDSGEEVPVRIPDASLFRQSARVKLHREMPRFVDGPVFRFRGYVDGSS